MKISSLVAVLFVAVSTVALTTNLSAGCSGCGTHTTKAGAEASKVETRQLTIVETATAAGSFTTLVAAIKAAGLVETLSGEGPFTVFAPNDEAFAKLPKGTVESLLQDKKRLTELLTYHVIPGKVMADAAKSLSSAKTVQGRSLRLDSSAGMRVNQAHVTTSDVIAANGVIHVIDEVLVPN